MSKIPDTIDALLTRLPLWLPTDVQISDGPPFEWLKDDAVVIGWQTEDRQSVTVTTEREGLHGDDREQFVVLCFISCSAATLPIKTVRDTAFDLYSTIADRLKADTRLGGVVLSSRASIAELTQIQIQTGATAELIFQITCDAFA